MPNPDKPNWKLRRLIIFSLFYFSLGCIVFLIGWGEDTTLHTQSLWFAWASAFSTMLSYAGWATWEDVNLAKIIRAEK